MLSRIRCLLTGHKWVKTRFPENPEGSFLRCRRCGKETDDTSTAVPFL